jgi:hypothetical protein
MLAVIKWFAFTVLSYEEKQQFHQDIKIVEEA